MLSNIVVSNHSVKRLTYISCIVPPLVTAAPRQYVLLGDSATLRCNVTGDPEPVVLWRRNGTVIDLDENARYSKPMLGLLQFTNATTEDAGVYECIANNAKGGDVTNITLTVLSKSINCRPMQGIIIHVCM